MGTRSHCLRLGYLQLLDLAHLLWRHEILASEQHRSQSSILLVHVVGACGVEARNLRADLVSYLLVSRWNYLILLELQLTGSPSRHDHHGHLRRVPQLILLELPVGLLDTSELLLLLLWLLLLLSCRW